MPDPAERFIDAAVAPLGENAELHVMARNELMERVGQYPDLPGASLEAAASRLERLGTPRRWPAWKIALYAVTALASVVTLDLCRRSYAAARQLAGHISAMGGGAAPEPEPIIGRGLTEEQRFLLFGDTQRTQRAERYKALWESDPDNPAFFAEYTVYHRRDHDRLPPDFLATARTIDPENSWFTLMEASALAKGSVEKGRLTPKERKDGVLPAYRILDEARYREALQRVHEAGRQPRFDSYQARLLSMRIPLLPKRTDFLSQVAPMAYLAGLPADTLTLRGLMDAVDARGEELAASGDRQAFRELTAAWKSCLNVWAETEGVSLVDVLVLKVCLGATARRFEDTARKLGMEAEAARWGKIAGWIKADHEAREKRSHDPAIRMHGGVFAGLGLTVISKQSSKAPAITMDDLKPARLADHEFFIRMFSPAVWLVIGLMAAAAAAYRLRAGVLVRRLSHRLEGLLHPADWLWIIGGGIVLPFLFYQGVYRLTPWGAREWSIAASSFIVPSGQFSAAGWLMIVMPVLIARWRLAVRGGMLGFQRRPSWWAWVGVVVGALSIPAFGLTFAAGTGSEATMIAAATMLGGLQLVWLAIGLRAVFGKRDQLLRRVTITRLLVPAYVAGMLLVVAAMPLYHAAEKRWLAHDRLMEITPDSPSLGRYEYEVAKAMRSELRGLLHP